MSEVRLSPKARAKHLRNMQQARAIGIIENKVYSPFKAAWAWFMTKQALQGFILAAVFYLVIGLIGGLDSPEYY